MTEQKQEKTNDQLAYEAFQSNMKNITEFIEARDKAQNLDDETELETLESDFNNRMLSIDQKRVYDILLYFGGPGGGFKVTCNSENELESVEFWHSEWFHYKDFKLDSDQEKEFVNAYSGVLESLEIKYW